jgi:hypothetical protein
MEDEITLEQLSAWHRQRAAEIIATMARATYVPTEQRVELTALAKFHQAAARLLQTYTL